MDGLAKPARWWPGIRAGHPLARDLVGYWPFWEGQGGKAYDVASPFDIANHSTLIDGPVWGSGPRGNTLVFDGADAYATGALPQGVLADAQFTVVWRSRFTGGTPAVDGIVNVQAASGAGGQIALAYYWDGFNGILVGNRQDNDHTKGAASAVTIADWHTFAFASTGTATTLYVDGVANSAAAGGSASPSGTDVVNIGCRADGSFHGEVEMDTLAIWDRAFSPAEVAAHAADPYDLIRPRAKTYIYATTPAAASIVVLRRRRECA